MNSSSEKGKSTLYGWGYYRLSRVDWRPLADHNRPAGAPQGTTGPHLFPMAYGFQKQNPHKCHHRSAATAWVNEDHAIELYCSEYDAIDGETEMNFTRRRPD